MNVVLLGDSVFDNRLYTEGGWDVARWLRLQLPEAEVTLLAKDGATTADIGKQLRRMPEGATHLVMSMGGNDALAEAGVLNKAVGDVGEAVFELASVVDDFDANYRECLADVLSLGLPTTVCTIYNGCSKSWQEQVEHAGVVALLDNAIIQAAMDARVPVIDLRRVLTMEEDYFNPIEPGYAGGGKLAAVIANAVRLKSPPAIMPSGEELDRHGAWRMPHVRRNATWSTDVDVVDDDAWMQLAGPLGGDLEKVACPECGEESLYASTWEVDGEEHSDCVQECACDLPDEVLEDVMEAALGRQENKTVPEDWGEDEEEVETKRGPEPERLHLNDVVDIDSAVLRRARPSKCQRT